MYESVNNLDDPQANHCIAVDARGCGKVDNRIEQSGMWPHQAASGVFFRTAVLDYRRYKDIFPAWALALASRHA